MTDQETTPIGTMHQYRKQREEKFRTEEVDKEIARAAKREARAYSALMEPFMPTVQRLEESGILKRSKQKESNQSFFPAAEFDSSINTRAYENDADIMLFSAEIAVPDASLSAFGRDLKELLQEHNHLPPCQDMVRVQHQIARYMGLLLAHFDKEES